MELRLSMTNGKIFSNAFGMKFLKFILRFHRTYVQKFAKYGMIYRNVFSKMECFSNIAKNWKPLIIFTKRSILSVWQGSEYASDLGNVLTTSLKSSSAEAYLGS